MRFIITAQSNPDAAPAGQPAAFDADLFKAYMRFNEEMHQAGVLVASEGLNPAAQGARIAVANGKRYVVAAADSRMHRQSDRGRNHCDKSTYCGPLRGINE